ncbi:MAG TPA: DUF1501 domain-containing protein [Flavobacterium sp.]|jgi:uncharacterized protein (DUF1501 family)
MQRRKFLKSTAIVSAPLFFNKIPVMAAENLQTENLQIMANAASECGKILVIIQLSGGCDGLSLVAPRDKWAELTAARSNILINENQVLRLDNNDTTGLHPATPEFQNLYNEGKMMIVQGVSYPNPSYSHFRAIDIWFSGVDSNQISPTGWIGRALNSIYPDYPAAYPNPTMRDPLAVQIGSGLSFSLQGPSVNMGYSSTNPDDLLNVINATSDPAPDSDYGAELTFLRLMKDQSNAYRSVLQNAYNTPVSAPVTYPDNSLAEQLKIVARLINGGLKTPVYIVNHPRGFDTHGNQVSDSDKTKGELPRNLAILSEAVSAFQNDLRNMGKEDKVTGMTHSEFGRRVVSNDSRGTDHGTAAPVLFFGAALNTSPSAVAGTAHPIPGMIGTSPDLPANATVDDEVPMQFDYRQVYSSIMQDWLCMSEAQATAALGRPYAKLPIFASTQLSTPKFDNSSFLTIYPNPVSNNQINIKFATYLNDNIAVAVYNIQGVKVFDSKFVVNGSTLNFSINNRLSSGTYILEVITNGARHTEKLLIL